MRLMEQALKRLKSGSARTAYEVCVLALLASLLIVLSTCGFREARAQVQVAPAVVVHYSPAEDLEAIDLEILDKATHQVDLVLYAFDDKPLAMELLALAKRGVAIRIYRDQQQYQGEVARGKKGGANLTALFAGQANVHIRIKGSIALAHLKSYCVDGAIVRDGSANWSVQGEKVQDNSLLLISELSVATAFAQNFETLWARPPNVIVQ